MRSATRVVTMADGFTKNPDYRVDLEPAGRRIRVEFNGVSIADSRHAVILRETRHTATYYFPKSDVRMDLMTKTDHRTHCPFKGNASYWTVKVGDREAENAVWGYEASFAEVEGLSDYVSFYWDRMDAWYEDEVQVYEQKTVGHSYALNPFVDWLLREAWEATTTRELVSRFVDLLNENGASVTRLNVIIQTLHPLLMANAYRWRQDVEGVDRFDATHDSVTEQAFLDSPLKIIFDGEGGLRRRINAETADDFPIFTELNAEGATDYVAMPMRFSDGQVNAITMVTDAPDGFSTETLGHIHDVLPLMARLFEVHAKERMAATLMRTFIGEHTGERVMNGLVKRGDSEDLHAVIWFCDLRNSTPLAESMSRSEFLDYLNRYFDCMAGAVVDNGGEVLRFIGDAALAIFPIEDRTGVRGSCSETSMATMRALKAARDASELVEQVNGVLEQEGRPPIGFGIGLHIGDVTYGNIGIPERLEFTVIGPAVNQAARIEAMSKELGTNIIASKAFAENHHGDLRSLGVYELRGVAGAHELFSI